MLTRCGILIEIVQQDQQTISQPSSIMGMIGIRLWESKAFRGLLAISQPIWAYALFANITPGDDRRSSAQFEPESLVDQGGRHREPPIEQVRNVDEQGDPVQRLQSFNALLKSLTAEEVRQLLADIEEGEEDAPSLKPHELQALAYQVGVLLGAEALTLDYDSWQSVAVSDRVRATLDGWAGVDVAAALDFVESMESKTEQQAGLGGVVHALLRSDVAHAGRVIQTMASGRERAQAVDAFVQQQLKTTGLTGVVTWLDGLQAEKLKSLRAQAARSVSKRLARENGSSKLSAFKEWLGASVERQQVDAPTIAQIAQSTQSDADHAAQWLSDFSSTSTGAQALSLLVGDWAIKAPNKAGYWLRENLHRPGMEPSLIAFCSQIASVDQDSARAWSSMIQDPVKRGEIEQQISTRETTATPAPPPEL